MKPYYTYILQCADGTYYIGHTDNLDQRIKKHNGQKKGGAKYTRSRRPVHLLYVEECPDKSSAMKREYVLKQLSHQQKAALCISVQSNSINTLEKIEND